MPSIGFIEGCNNESYDVTHKCGLPMLERIEVNKVYKSPSGLRFRVLHMARHAQDCSWAMVVYTNLEPTKDAVTGTVWTISETIFLRTFSEL